MPTIFIFIIYKNKQKIKETRGFLNKFNFYFSELTSKLITVDTWHIYQIFIS